jgi:hypothetical protein
MLSVCESAGLLILLFSFCRRVAQLNQAGDRAGV